MAIKSLLPYLPPGSPVFVFYYMNYLPVSSKQLYSVNTIKHTRKAGPEDIQYLLAGLRVINAKM